MGTESVAKRAIALLTERGAMRTAQIAEALGVENAAVASSLGAYVNNGTLTACKVESPGTPPTNEYRISASGKTTDFREYKPKETGKKTPPVLVPAVAAAAPSATPKKAKKRSAPVRKVQRKTARKVQKTVSAAVREAAKEEKRYPSGSEAVKSFRAAIASDGSMIFLGASSGPFELNRPESRVLIEFVRTLDGGGVGA